MRNTPKLRRRKWQRREPRDSRSQRWVPGPWEGDTPERQAGKSESRIAGLLPVPGWGFQKRRHLQTGMLANCGRLKRK